MSFSDFSGGDLSNMNIVNRGTEFDKSTSYKKEIVSYIIKNYNLYSYSLYIGINAEGADISCANIRNGIFLGSYLGCSNVWGARPPLNHDLQFSIMPHLRITDEGLPQQMRNCGIKPEKLLKINMWWKFEGKKLATIPKEWKDEILKIACLRQDYFAGLFSNIIKECYLKNLENLYTIKTSQHIIIFKKDVRIRKMKNIYFIDNINIMQKNKECKNPFLLLRQSLSERLKQKKCKAAEGIENTVLALLNDCMKKRTRAPERFRHR
jgi:hypothetical protein